MNFIKIDIEDRLKASRNRERIVKRLLSLVKWRRERRIEAMLVITVRFSAESTFQMYQCPKCHCFVELSDIVWLHSKLDGADYPVGCDFDGADEPRKPINEEPDVLLVSEVGSQSAGDNLNAS